MEHYIVVTEMGEKFQAMLDRMTPKEREQFTKLMRQENTFLAEDIQDVLAILAQIKEQKKIH